MVSRTDMHDPAPDLLVIGLGTTGAMALHAAREAGATAMGVDLSLAPPVGAIAGCQYGTRVWGVFTDGTVVWTNEDGTTRCSTRAIIVATGGIDLPLPLPGWQLVGVTGAFRASRLLEDGTDVAVIRGPHAGLGGRSPDLGRFRVLMDYELNDGSPVSFTGTTAVESATIDASLIATRHVLLDNGLQPENALARMAGVPSSFSTRAGGDVVNPGSVIAASGTLISVVGNATGIGGDDDAMHQEAVATAQMLARSGHGGHIQVSMPNARPPWQSGRHPVLPIQSTDSTLICPDEGVTIGMVREAIARGATTVNDVKRRTRASMAVCQGRDCVWSIRALLAEANRDDQTPMTPRPPITGITLGELAALHNVT